MKEVYDKYNISTASQHSLGHSDCTAEPRLEIGNTSLGHETWIPCVHLDQGSLTSRGDSRFEV